MISKYGKVATVLAVIVTAELVVVALVSAATIVTRTETKEYVAVGGALSTNCNFQGTGRNLGGACFQVQISDKWAGFTVADEFQSGVLVRYSWHTSNDTIISQGIACGTTSNLTIPSGAATLVVNLPQVLAGCPGRGLKGMVTATFSRPLP